MITAMTMHATGNIVTTNSARGHSKNHERLVHVVTGDRRVPEP
jgi:hypothetical protein